MTRTASKGVATIVAAVTIAFFLLSLGKTASTPEPRSEVHAIWAHPSDAGQTPESVRAFVEQCKRANIDLIVMMGKGTDGSIFWKSRRFPQAVAPAYQSFDLIEDLTREAHAQGIRVHIWLCDFVEGINGAAYREHPEWAQLNADGGITSTEPLNGGRPYGGLGMCPARRPGYTDQWLLPMIEELAANYPIDGIHHDYVRYTGDVAPDSYCFCDFCLKNLPRHALFNWETRPEERYRAQMVRPRIEANWEDSPSMLPADWEQRDRREKADFLLNGRTLPGGPADMRYFFYEYRVDQINAFVREAWERVKRINPRIEISAAVFKNPIQSARFIGQKWNDWTPWIDTFMPMSYRSHFQGSFDAYLDHLTEITTRQMEWIGRRKPLYVGIATTYLFREETQPLDDLRQAASELKALPATDAKNRAEKARAIATAFEAVRARLARFAPERERELATLVAAVAPQESGPADLATPDALVNLVNRLRREPPPGYLPPEKLAQAIAAARKAQPDGIVIFAAGSVTRENLWPALEAAFER